jgi:hypothetical protein
MNARLLLCAVPVLAALAGCEWHVVEDHAPSGASTADAHGGPPGPPEPSFTSTDASCEASIGGVDRWKELLVINRSVLFDRRAQNDAPGGAWSFRSRFEELAGSTAEAPALVQAWLAEWTTRTSVGAHAAPVTARPSVANVITGPWRESVASDGADRYADGEPLPLDRAPFRLVAIVNRLDLREHDLGCDGAAGELRFVYTAIDPTTRLAIPFSLIVEIPYPTSRSPREWAQSWHDVAQKPFGAEYNDALAALTTEVTSKASRTATRVRTNEIALGLEQGLPWEMREFAVDASSPARLVQRPLTATPRIELAGSPSLDAWTEDNASRVLAGTQVLAGALQAGAAPMTSPSFRWPPSSISEELRHALSVGTCNGCHGGERPAGDPLRFQHLAPGDTKAAYYATTNGETQVSRYLHDPSSQGADELGRRGRAVARMLCTSCSPPGEPSPPSAPYVP